MRRALCVLALCLLTCSTMVIGCASLPRTAPPHTDTSPSPAHAALAPIITDQETGQPIAGAEVSLHTGETGVTNAAGYVEFRNLVLGVRGITVKATGYHDAFFSLEAFTSNTQVPIAMAPLVPDPPAPPPASVAQWMGPWRGRLSVPSDGRCFVDETGQCQLPLMAHFMEAFSAYVRRPAEVEAQLQTIKAAGYDGIRFLDTLGYYDNAWGGREVMPWRFTNRSGRSIDATSGYYEQLKAFLGVLKRLGLVAHHSRGDLNGRALDQVVQHAERVAQIYDDIGWSTLALFEGNNEDFQNGDFGADGLRKIVEPAKRRGAVVASSCPAGCTEERADVLAYSRGFSVRYYHGHRPGLPTDRLRHIFSTTREQPEGSPRLAWEGEPTGPNQFPGPGVTVDHTEDPEELALLAFNRWLARGAWTYMSQYGVFWNGRIERHAGFHAVPGMRGILKAFAPDVMAWPTVTHGGAPDTALTSPTGYFGDPGVTSGPARIEMAIRGDRRRFVATVHGGRGPRAIKNVLGCRLDLTVVAVNPDETIRIDAVTLEPNATLAIDYRVGRALLGACR